ncbi:MAG: GPW/gp25 family protein [Cyanobacteria bacterium CRU_2_1]|nr:GPW/gp25 family protein [Cyanobacteria bacterium CRU_2_1]
MDEDRKAYLGTGWSFPPAFDKKGKRVRMVSAEDDICQSLQILLSTSLGERVMQPTYGCNLQDLLFESLTPTVASSIKELVRTAILYFEPRIRLNQLDLSLDQQLRGVVNITVDYTVISTNSRFNYVYPFYLQEGSGSLLPVSSGVPTVPGQFAL